MAMIQQADYTNMIRRMTEEFDEVFVRFLHLFLIRFLYTDSRHTNLSFLKVLVSAQKTVGTYDLVAY